MVGGAIHNEVNHNNRPIGISFRQRDQLSGNTIWSVFEKVTQSIARFNTFDTLIVVEHAVRMPVGFSRVKTKGRPLSIMPHLKRSFIEVKVEMNWLDHVLITVIAKTKKNWNYEAYHKGRKIHPIVQNLQETSGIDLDNDAGIPELLQFQDHFREYNIVVYEGLNRDSIMFEGQVESSRRQNVLYDDVTRHYHMSASMRGAMAKHFVCNACGLRDVVAIPHTNAISRVVTLWSPPHVPAGVQIPCEDCNRHFRSQTCFDNHKKKRGNKKTVCERK